MKVKWLAEHILWWLLWLVEHQMTRRIYLWKVGLLYPQPTPLPLINTCTTNPHFSVASFKNELNIPLDLRSVFSPCNSSFRFLKLLMLSMFGMFVHVNGNTMAKWYHKYLYFLLDMAYNNHSGVLSIMMMDEYVSRINNSNNSLRQNFLIPHCSSVEYDPLSWRCSLLFLCEN